VSLKRFKKADYLLLAPAYKKKKDLDVLRNTCFLS